MLCNASSKTISVEPISSISFQDAAPKELSEGRRRLEGWEREYNIYLYRIYIDLDRSQLVSICFFCKLPANNSGEGILDLSLCSSLCWAMSKVALHERRLAEWKVWWGQEVVEKIAKSLHEHIDVQRLPGQGQILETSSFNAGVLEKSTHVQCVAEALLRSYPNDRQPSAYLLGDSVLKLNALWNHSLLGPPHEENPIKEKSRRELALGEGDRLKKLLAYVRASALKTQYGRKAETTFLKSLANERPIRRSPTSSIASSTPSMSPSREIANPAPQPDRNSSVCMKCQGNDGRVLVGFLY